MKRIICLLLVLCLGLPLVSCELFSRSSINGVKLKDYSITYSDEDSDYSRRAAEYIQEQIAKRTGIRIHIQEDSEPVRTSHEIIVGETEREISKNLDADTEGLQFAILANENQIALEGDYFIIAAAAYFFIEAYVPRNNFEATVPKEVHVYNPIVKEAKNFILLIGDGMGVYQTQMFDHFENNIDYSDGEDIFYGYYLPYMGYSITNSLSGVTDSAAGGTAISCGTKTLNEYIGQDKDGNDLKSLTELARELGMGAGVMSTEKATGATPATFSAHIGNRDSVAAIRLDQILIERDLGVHIDCGYDEYKVKGVGEIEEKIENMLGKLESDKGFFLMYEEAYIDKHCHKNNMENTFMALVRFNQAIGRFMEYAFYNPDTFVLITADHETGDLYTEEDGTLAFHHDDHTSANVQIFAYGKGAELFDGRVIQNIQIGHTIASLMGVNDFGDQSQYQYLR